MVKEKKFTLLVNNYGLEIKFIFPHQYLDKADVIIIKSLFLYNLR